MRQGLIILILLLSTSKSFAQSSFKTFDTKVISPTDFTYYYEGEPLLTIRHEIEADTCYFKLYGRPIDSLEIIKRLFKSIIYKDSVIYYMRYKQSEPISPCIYNFLNTK